MISFHSLYVTLKQNYLYSILVYGGPFWPKTDIMMPIQCLTLSTTYGLTQDFFLFSHLICVTEHVIAFGFACMFIYIYGKCQ